jgi:hypothetical protein
VRLVDVRHQGTARIWSQLPSGQPARAQQAKCREMTRSRLDETAGTAT